MQSHAKKGRETYLFPDCSLFFFEPIWLGIASSMLAKHVGKRKKNLMARMATRVDNGMGVASRVFRILVEAKDWWSSAAPRGSRQKSAQIPKTKNGFQSSAIEVEGPQHKRLNLNTCPTVLLHMLLIINVMVAGSNPRTQNSGTFPSEKRSGQLLVNAPPFQ